MYVKEELVYDKHTGGLVGFAKLGEINSNLLAFEHSMLKMVLLYKRNGKLNRKIFQQPYCSSSDFRLKYGICIANVHFFVTILSFLL